MDNKRARFYSLSFLFLLNNLPVTFWRTPDLYKKIPTAKPIKDMATLPVAQLANVF
jgi:hypothetical protein